MQIHVHTDNHVNGSAGLTSHVESVVEAALGRFGRRITRVEVHLGDENSHKHGDRDKRCAMEARLSSLDPIAVTAQGGSVDETIHAAVDKLVTAIDRTLGRKYDAKGRPSTAQVASEGFAMQFDDSESEDEAEVATAEE